MKTVIALLALAGSLVLPNAYARDEGTWDSTRAHVQPREQRHETSVGRTEHRWDSTRAHVQAQEDSESNTLSSGGDRWDSTRSKPPRTDDRRRAAQRSAPLICACLANDQLA